jgi:hypothetical protein
MACIELDENWDKSHKSATDLTRLDGGGGKRWLEEEDVDATVRTASTAASEESVQWTSDF